MKLIVQNLKIILIQNAFEDTPDSLINNGKVYLKADIPGYQEVSIEGVTPGDFADENLWGFEYVDGQLQRTAAYKQYAYSKFDSAARDTREIKLAWSDWTQMPDVSIATKATWATWRQSLRDITSQPGYPFDIEWPLSPMAPVNSSS